MDFKTALLDVKSKQQAQILTDFIGADQGLFDELMAHFFGEEYRLTQKAAWIMLHCAKRYPFLINPHLKQMVYNLQDPQLPVAVKRNSVRILQDIEIPEDLMGIAADCCFNFLADPKEAVAVRVFSMTVLYNICQKEPDLGNELKILIEEFLPHGSAGFKSRGNKILRNLKKIT
jgi:hypothetical protein